MASTKYRSHGFECPPNYYQISSIVLIVVTTVFSSLSQIRQIGEYMLGVYILFFYGSLGFLIFFWFRASILDPTDPVVVANRLAITKGYPFDSSRYDSMCTICNTSVGENSKHCGSCNRCVEKFDHHCIWLNNCIGSKNYRAFVFLITTVFIHENTILAAGIYIVYNVYDDHEDDKQNFAIQLFLVIQAFLINVFIFNLIILHIWLYKQGITTYELIKRRNKRKRRIQSIGPTEDVNPKVSLPQSPKHILPSSD